MVILFVSHNHLQAFLFHSSYDMMKTRSNNKVKSREGRFCGQVVEVHARFFIFFIIHLVDFM
jgi:hypothetical protein